jgi:hypothetical protein
VGDAAKYSVAPFHIPADSFTLSHSAGAPVGRIFLLCAPRLHLKENKICLKKEKK